MKRGKALVFAVGWFIGAAEIWRWTGPNFEPLSVYLGITLMAIIYILLRWVMWHDRDQLDD